MSGQCFGSFGPVSIGDCGSKSIINVKRSAVTENTTKSVMSSFSSNSTSKVAIQDQNVNVIGSCCRPLVIDQFFNVSAASFNKDTTTLASETLSKMISDIKTKISQEQSSKTELMSSTVGAGSAVQNLQDALTQISQSDMVKQAIKQNIDKTVNVQKQSVNIVCANSESGGSIVPETSAVSPDGRSLGSNGCYINQNFVANLVSNNTFETIMNELNKNEQLRLSVDEFESKQTAENKGLNDLIGKWGMIIGIIAVVVIVAIFLLPKIIDSAGKNNLSVGPTGISASAPKMRLFHLLREIAKKGI